MHASTLPESEDQRNYGIDSRYPALARREDTKRKRANGQCADAPSGEFESRGNQKCGHAKDGADCEKEPASHAVGKIARPIIHGGQECRLTNTS